MQSISSNLAESVHHLPRPESASAQGVSSFCRQTARIAIKSLHAELTLYPKPGLVSPVDNGSHEDMDAALFMRSLFSLRHYFFRMARAGASEAPFAHLKDLGLRAEQTMLAATLGVNTHRGAIFSLGLLCASCGYGFVHGMSLSDRNLRSILLAQWGKGLHAHAMNSAQPTNGVNVAALYAVSGAREEARRAFPSVFEIALPKLRAALAEGKSPELAQTDALFSLMAQVSDTNVYHRGGGAGAEFVKNAARHFLSLGGTSNPDWRETALECHRQFVTRRLSPGGAADLLAASWFVHLVTQAHQLSWRNSHD